MTVAEQTMFTGISGNLGGLYVDRRKAQAVGLTDMIVFEMAAASLLSTCLSRLAGPDFRIARVETNFDNAVSVGATIEASATLTSKTDEGLTFRLTLKDSQSPFCDGEALLVPVQGS
jgi:acyl dehydratase